MLRFSLAAFLLVCSSSVLAQEGMSDEEAVIAAVHELWEGMRTTDSTRIRNVIHPDAVGFSVSWRDGNVALRSSDPDDAVRALGTPHEGIYDERVFDEEVRIDGGLATYYTYYEFWIDDRLSHCGIDAFQLVKTDGGWKIFVLSDTRRACE